MTVSTDSGSRLTVVVPTYNRPGYLAECLTSIGRASITGFRLIILDNASTTDYSTVLDSHRSLNLEYVRNGENIGAPRNIERALRQFRDEEFLLVFHDDDIMHPRMMEWQLEALAANQDASFACCQYLEFIDGTEPGYLAWDNLDGPCSELVDAAGLSRRFMTDVPIAYGSTMYRTALMGTGEPDLGRFDMYADRPYLLDVVGAGTCAVLRAPLVMYRLHKAQDSRSDVLTAQNLIQLMGAYRDVLP